MEPEEGSWLERFRPPSEGGLFHVFITPCETDKDHDYHFSLDWFSPPKDEGEVDGGDVAEVSLAKALACLAQFPGLEGPVMIYPSVFFPSDTYTSILEDQRSAFAEDRLGSGVVLRGVDLDFTQSELPLRGLRLNDYRDGVVVSLTMAREPREDGWLDQLLREVFDIAGSFVSPRDPNGPPPAQTDAP